MKTEFLIPFELDTSVIEQRLEVEGYEEAINRIVENAMKEIKSTLPQRYGSVNWNMVLSIELHKWLSDHIEEITDTAVLLLTERAGNKKRWREALKDVKEKMKED